MSKTLMPGEVLRIRYPVHVETDGVKNVGYRPQDEGRSKEQQRVFVVLVLGTEPLRLEDEVRSLDPDEALAALGWHREQ
jgi:hypothetical protein